MNLQETVTQDSTRLAMSSRNYVGLTLSIIFFGVVVVAVIISVSVKSKKYDFLAGKEFYVYYTSVERSISLANTVSREQQLLGGAGYICENFNYYISAFLYDNFEDAKSVAQKNLSAYPDGGVMPKKTQKLNKKAKKVIKNDEKCSNCVHIFENTFNCFYDLALENDEKMLTEAAVFNKVFKQLESLNSLSKKIEDINSPLSFELDSLISKVKKYLATANTTVERGSGLKLLCFEIIDGYNTIANWLNG